MASVIRTADRGKPKPKAAPVSSGAATPFSGGSGDLQRQAAAIVASQLDPQIGAIGQQIKQSQGSEKRGLADIGKYYGQAGSAINQSRGAVGSENAASLADIARLYGGAEKGQQQVYGKAQQGISGELARLGIQAALPGASQRMSSDAKFMEGLTRLQGANAGANSRQMGANTAGLISAISGETSASGAQSKSDLSREMQRMIDNLTFQKNATEATRSGKEQQVLSGLQQAAAAQANANARLGIEARNSDISGARAAAEIQHLMNPPARQQTPPTKGMLGADALISSLGLPASTTTNYENALGNFTGASSYSDALKQLNDYVNQYALGRQYAPGKVGTISSRDAAALKTALAMAFGR
jgi:hypothetical protein